MFKLLLVLHTRIVTISKRLDSFPRIHHFSENRKVDEMPGWFVAFFMCPLWEAAKILALKSNASRVHLITQEAVSKRVIMNSCNPVINLIYINYLSLLVYVANCKDGYGLKLG